jgi:hypothetical protein
MPASKETLQAMAREYWGTNPAPAEVEEAMALLNPVLEGLGELDALNLEHLEPALIFAVLEPGTGETS